MQSCLWVCGSLLCFIEWVALAVSVIQLLNRESAGAHLAPAQTEDQREGACPRWREGKTAPVCKPRLICMARANLSAQATSTVNPQLLQLCIPPYGPAENPCGDGLCEETETIVISPKQPQYTIRRNCCA